MTDGSVNSGSYAGLDWLSTGLVWFVIGVDAESMTRMWSMKTLIPLLLGVATLFAAGARANSSPPTSAPQDCPNVSFSMDARQWAEPKVVVAPEYPAAELAAGLTATVDVEANVSLGARIATIHRVTSEPPNAAFEEAVLKVVKLWGFYRQTNCECMPVPSDVKLRVWFELKDGKPSISISSRSRNTEARAGAPKLTNRREIMASLSKSYPRSARRAGEEADVYAAVHLEPESGRVREVEIKWVGGANSTKAAFMRAAQTALAEGVYSLEGVSKDVKPIACLAVNYRLSGHAEE